MKNSIFLLSLIVIILSGCHTEKKDTDSSLKRIVLNMDLGQMLYLSDIADSIEVIPFEQTDESDIAQIRGIIPYKDKYYILNTVGFTSGRVLVFDKQGRFIKKIDKRGGGPGEYVELEDMVINTADDELILLTYPNGIFKYDTEGNFKEKVEKSEHADNLAVDAVGNLYETTWCYENRPFKLLCIGESESIPYFALPKKDFVRVNQHSHTNELESYRGKVYYSPPYSDTIYDVTKGQIKPEILLDYGNKRKPIEKIFTEGKDMKQLDDAKKKYSSCFTTDVFCFSDNFLLLGSIDAERHGVMSMHSFKTGKTLSAHRLVDDIFFPNNTMVFKPLRLPFAVDEGCLLWFVRPSWLLQGYETYKKKLTAEQWEAFSKKNPRMIEVCNQLDEESNPVLLRIKIKDF